MSSIEQSKKLVVALVAISPADSRILLQKCSPSQFTVPVVDVPAGQAPESALARTLAAWNVTGTVIAERDASFQGRAARTVVVELLGGEPVLLPELICWRAASFEEAFHLLRDDSESVRKFAEKAVQKRIG